MVLNDLPVALSALRRDDLLYLNVKDLAFEDCLRINSLLKKHIVTAIDLTHLYFLYRR